MKRKSIVIISTLLAMFVLGMVAYHYLSPKVVVENKSETTYKELIITLPKSGLSFGPILPGESSTIYYSPQEESGELKYRLIFENNTVAKGVIPYSKRIEWGTKVKFVIKQSHNVTVTN